MVVEKPPIHSFQWNMKTKGQPPFPKETGLRITLPLERHYVLKYAGIFNKRKRVYTLNKEDRKGRMAFTNRREHQTSTRWHSRILPMSTQQQPSHYRLYLISKAVKIISKSQLMFVKNRVEQDVTHENVPCVIKVKYCSQKIVSQWLYTHMCILKRVFLTVGHNQKGLKTTFTKYVRLKKKKRM